MSVLGIRRSGAGIGILQWKTGRLAPRVRTVMSFGVVGPGHVPTGMQRVLPEKFIRIAVRGLNIGFALVAAASGLTSLCLRKHDQ